jgi:hypothetical protein
MAIFRQYVAPLLIVLVFLVALLAVGARIFLPSDMAAPAPIEDVEAAQAPAFPQLGSDAASVAEIPPTLELLVKGLPVYDEL